MPIARKQTAMAGKSARSGFSIRTALPAEKRWTSDMPRSAQGWPGGTEPTRKTSPQRIGDGMKAKKTKHSCGNASNGLMITSCRHGYGGDSVLDNPQETKITEKTMSFLDIFRVTSIKKENEQLMADLVRLRSLMKEIGAPEVENVKLKLKEYERKCHDVMAENHILENTKSSLQRDIADRQSQLVGLDDEVLLESFALYKPKFPFTNSASYKTKIDSIRDEQKALIRIGRAVTSDENWTVNNSKAEGKKMINDMKKLLLRSFNNECDYCVDNVKFNNLDNFESRIEKSFIALEKLGRITNARITNEYKKLKIDELRLAFEYQVKKQEEKDEQRKAREELREQQKVEREIRQAREKIEKERKHFSAAIQDLQRKLAISQNEEEKLQIEERLQEVSTQLVALDGEEKIIDYREKNAKAGYIYIVSNLGAFGENIFKIGMTRRLEPMERIDELGDASVPFEFDLHAMIFSDNAPELEAKLHGHFNKSRINCVNTRKEFFRADIKEIEKVIRDNYDKVFDLVHDSVAEQYRESLKLTKEREELRAVA